jgi:hypothetical protein
MSEFRLAIVRADGQRVLLMPGGRAEHDLIQACADAILAKGVGVFRTEAHVRRAIEQGMHEALLAIKSDVLPTKR